MGPGEGCVTGLWTLIDYSIQDGRWMPSLYARIEVNRVFNALHFDVFRS